jgi:hypothetical protein
LPTKGLYRDAVIAIVGVAARVGGLVVAIHLNWQLPGVFLALLGASLLRAISAMILVGAVCVPIRMKFDLLLMKLLLWKSAPRSGQRASRQCEAISTVF